jgi:carboxyl-terminal processing protease
MKMNKVYFPIVIAVAVAVGLLLGSKLNSSTENAFLTKNANKNKLNKLIDFIENEYVDSLNTDSIVDLTVNGILEKLDPHSVYIPKSELEAVEQSMRGDFVGIGVNFYMYNDSVTIIKPIPNGPSEKAGLKAGDRILFAA